jgi:hypothetical protein
MSVAIHKYPLTLQYGISHGHRVSHVTLPKGAKILHASDQREEFNIWAIVDLEEKAAETRHFLILGTGQQFDKSDSVHLQHSAASTSGTFSNGYDSTRLRDRRRAHRRHLYLRWLRMHDGERLSRRLLVDRPGFRRGNWDLLELRQAPDRGARRAEQESVLDMSGGAMKHWPWQHDFKPVAAEQVISSYDGEHEALRTGIGTRETMVLLRCECGKVKSKRLRGHWRLEEIKGEHSRLSVTR